MAGPYLGNMSAVADWCPMRLLVVEDEPELADLIATGLREHGFAVDISLNGEDALEKAFINTYDLVVLDRDLPVVHGDVVCRRLLAVEPPPRILMLTAASELDQRVEGLNLGADDYLAKPFAFAELVARIRALGRRSALTQLPVIDRAGIRLDINKMAASRDGRELRLTRKEIGVLKVLLTADGGVISAEHMLERIWDENADPFTNAVRITVGTLRKKLGPPQVIQTVIGAGYRIPE
jgi:DNA-binding response OmpR family regulator